MRIAVYHNQPSGGARRALSGFGRELARRHTVDVYTLATSDQDFLHDEDWASSVTRLPYQPRRSVRMGLFLNDLQQSRSLDDLERANALAAMRIDDGAYDIVLVDACRFTFAPYVLRHLRTPAAYYCHHGPWRMYDAAGADARSAYEEARRAVHGPFERRRVERIRATDRELVRHARVVLVNSRYSAERVWREYGVEAEFCPPGIDIPAARGSRDMGHILSVGSLDPHKGHDLVIRAVAKLPADIRPDLHIVANDGGRTYRERLERQAASVGVRLAIRMRITDEELEREYRDAVLFCYGARREPLGLAPLEAMSHGLAVVALYEGGVPETVLDGKTGFLTRADPELIALRIEQLLRDVDLRRRMESAGRREAVEGWAWRPRAARMERLLLEAAAPRPVMAGR